MYKQQTKSKTSQHKKPTRNGTRNMSTHHGVKKVVQKHPKQKRTLKTINQQSSNMRSFVRHNSTTTSSDGSDQNKNQQKVKNQTFFSDKVLDLQQCWACPNDQTPSQSFFCNSCGVLQNPFIPMGNQDYFSLYDLPISYDIDMGELEQKFRKLQQVIHPDLFSSKQQQEQDFSMQYSMNINHSYQILKDPLLRAKYIIYLFDPQLIQNDENYSEFSHMMTNDNNNNNNKTNMGRQCGKESANPSADPMAMSGKTNTRIDMMTLMEIFEKRTQIADTFDGAELFNIFQENEATKQTIFTKLSTLLKERQFDDALTQCELLGYYNSMQRDLKQRIPPKFFTDSGDTTSSSNSGPIQL